MDRCILVVSKCIKLCIWLQVLQHQTEAIARLGNVLKRDIRDMEIIMADDTEMAEDTN